MSSDGDSVSVDSSLPPPRKSRKSRDGGRENTLARVPDPLADARPTTSTSEIAAGFSRWVDASESFFYVELSSLILLFACVAAWSLWSESVWMHYALSVACVSFGICLILQTMEFLMPGFLEKKMIPESNGSEGHSVEKIMSVFLMLWWIVGTGIITFKGPFVTTSNGWFGAWGGLLTSIKWCVGIKSSHFEDLPDAVKYLKYLTFTSFVLICASIPPIRQGWPNWAGAGFSIAAAAITLIACAYLSMMYSDIPKKVMKLTVSLLFLLWVCVAGVCTFHGPFLTTNNGYFACWIGVLCTLRLAIYEMRDESPEHDMP